MRDAVQCSEVNEIHGRILSTVVGDDYVGKEVPHILLENQSVVSRFVEIEYMDPRGFVVTCIDIVRYHR